MKTFLLKNNIPTIQWSLLKDNTFYNGVIPKKFDLAVCPSKEYIIVDVDRHGDKNGFEHIPREILFELDKTFKYKTKNNGVHFWLRYTGSKQLLNKASGLGIDLRISASEESNGGYVKWHPRNTINPINAEIYALDTSSVLNKWIELLFSKNILNEDDR
jgi:hypothetical protein